MLKVDPKSKYWRGCCRLTRQDNVRNSEKLNRIGGINRDKHIGINRYEYIKVISRGCQIEGHLQIEGNFEEKHDGNNAR